MFQEMKRDEMMVLDGGAYPASERNLKSDMSDRESRAVGRIIMGAIKRAPVVGKAIRLLEKKYKKK